MNSQRRIILAVWSAAFLVATTACTGSGGPKPGGTPSTAPSQTLTSTAPLITIGRPTPGAIVSVPVAASGTANTFEAALTLDLLDSDGHTLCVRTIAATSGTGAPGTWATTLALAPPDSATAATLRAYEISAKDGSIVHLVKRSVTVSAQRPPIIVTAPACGAKVAPGASLAVAGRALVFEAQFTLELRDEAGAAKLTQQVTAESGEKESSWQASVPIPVTLPSGAYNLVAFDTSAKDGSVQNEFPLQVFVSP